MNKLCINCKKRLAVIDLFCNYKCEREHRDLLREKLDELKLRENNTRRGGKSTKLDRFCLK